MFQTFKRASLKQIKHIQHSRHLHFKCQLTTWISSSSKHRQNTTWEIHVVLSSPNSALSHTGSVRFDITALSFGIFCLFQWKIQTTSIYLKLTSRDGATVNNVLHLMCFENHVSRLPAFPLYQIRAHGGATMIYFYFIRELQIHIYSWVFFF